MFTIQKYYVSGLPVGSSDGTGCKRGIVKAAYISLLLRLRHKYLKVCEDSDNTRCEPSMPQHLSGGTWNAKVHGLGRWTTPRHVITRPDLLRLGQSYRCIRPHLKDERPWHRPHVTLEVLEMGRGGYHGLAS